MSDQKSSKELLSEAGELIRTGRSIEAIPILDAVLTREPENLWALEERGRAKSFTGDHKGALEDCDERLRLSTDPKGYACRAHANQLAGRLAGAIRDYTAAISLAPEHRYAYLHRGRLKMECGEIDEAIADFTAAIKHNEIGPLPGLLNRGKAKHFIGDWEGALSDFSEALRWEHDPPIYAPLYRGHVRLDSGDYQGAIADFTDAIEAFPQLSNAYRLRAEAREQLHDQEGAGEDRKRYQELGGNDLPAYA